MNIGGLIGIALGSLCLGYVLGNILAVEEYNTRMQIAEQVAATCEIKLDRCQHPAVRFKMESWDE